MRGFIASRARGRSTVHYLLRELEIGIAKIMHTSFRIGDTAVMASGGRCEGQPSFQGFALSLMGANEVEADRVFAALADGGQVQMPLTKTFWSPRFGMVADRFGVWWMVNVAA
jgi:PhnB protein